MAKRIDIQDGITLMLISRMKSTFYKNGGNNDIFSGITDYSSGYIYYLYARVCFSLHGMEQWNIFQI